MIRSFKVLALAAMTTAGALAATAAQASAANFNVYFAVQNNDASQNMGIVNIPSTVSGLGGGPISPGGLDPSTGHALWSDLLPALGFSRSITFTANRYADSTSGCNFTLKVTHDSNPSPYLLQFSVDNTSRCSVPAAVRTSDGQFTAQTSVLGWSS
jgi:hypothetical protein